MSKEVLSSKTKKELLEKATELSIVGRWNMTKDKLVEAILRAEKNGKVTKETKSAKSNSKIDNHEDVAAEDKNEKESAGIDVNTEEKKAYIENAEISGLNIKGKIDINSNKDYTYFGTIAGYAKKSNFSDCVSDVSFTNNDKYV